LVFEQQRRSNPVAAMFRGDVESDYVRQRRILLGENETHDFLAFQCEDAFGGWQR
jgi:hypothetical protein